MLHHAMPTHDLQLFVHQPTEKGTHLLERFTHAPQGITNIVCELSEAQHSSLLRNYSSGPEGAEMAIPGAYDEEAMEPRYQVTYCMHSM